MGGGSYLARLVSPVRDGGGEIGGGQNGEVIATG